MLRNWLNGVGQSILATILIGLIPAGCITYLAKVQSARTAPLCWGLAAFALVSVSVLAIDALHYQRSLGFELCFYMPVSQEDMEVLLRSQRDVRELQRLLPVHVRDTSPASAIGALLTVQLQHCDSIILLLMTGENNASAEALLRPMTECLLRLMWLCEDKKRAIDISTHKLKFPSISVLLNRLPHKTNEAKLRSALSQMHGMTHGGMEQLASYFSAFTLHPFERDLGVKMAAFLTVILAFTASATFCIYAKRTQEIKQVAKVLENTMVNGVLDMVKACLDELARRSNQQGQGTQP